MIISVIFRFSALLTFVLRSGTLILSIGRRDERMRQLYHKHDVQSISLLYDRGGMNALEDVKRNVLKHREVGYGVQSSTFV